MKERLPPLESLRVFEASARHGNFTRAAGELGVTPTAVSLRIRDLEAELGQALFRRNGPRIALTDAGTTLAARMADVMALARSAVTECRASGAILQLTTTPTFAHWLATRLPRYHALAGAAHLKLDISPELRPLGSFDVAIRSGYGHWRGLQESRLLPVLGTPMLSPSLAPEVRLRSPADLQRLPLLPDVNWEGWFRQAGVTDPRLNLTRTVMPTQDMGAAAAVSGTGVALLSPVLFASLISEGKLVRPFGQVFVGPETYYALRPTNGGRHEADEFIRWLQAELSSEWRVIGQSAGKSARRI